MTVVKKDDSVNSASVPKRGRGRGSGRVSSKGSVARLTEAGVVGQLHNQPRNTCCPSLGAGAEAGLGAGQRQG